MSFLERALKLARRGHKLFPIVPGQKSPPLVREWQRVATSDEAQIQSWWTQYPEANIGLHADGLLILDIDPKKGGWDSLAALEEEIELEKTYEVETPSLGRHIYYRLPAGVEVRNGVDVFGSGVDVRTTAGYVVAAGSKTAVGEYAVLFDEPIPEADPQLIARCTAPRREEPIVVSAADIDADAAVARAIEFLQTRPGAVQGQSGDLWTYATCCIVRDYGVPVDRAFEALKAWNESCAPPWEEDQLDRKIANAWRYAQNATPGSKSAEGLGFEKVAEGTAQLYSDEGIETANVELLHPSEVTTGEVLKTDYLIKGVIERESNAVLFGQWNVGKTFVILDMGAAIATGRDWFGKRVKKGRVLYLGYEGIRAMRKRMLALREVHPMLTDPVTPFAWAPIRDPLTVPAGKTELKAIIKRFGQRFGGPPALIIIDPLANALGGDDSDADLMAQLNRTVAALIKTYRCTVLRVHHTGHSNQERSRGHSSLPAGLDTEIRVDKREIALTKQRDDVREAFYWDLKVVAIGVDSDGDKVTTCVVDNVGDDPLALTRPERELLEELLDLKGDKQIVTLGDIRDCTPKEYATSVRKKMVAALVEKQFLKLAGKNTWELQERGAASVFD